MFLCEENSGDKTALFIVKSFSNVMVETGVGVAVIVGVIVGVIVAVKVGDAVRVGVGVRVGVAMEAVTVIVPLVYDIFSTKFNNSE
jgi:hypothetical protein